MPQHYSLKAFLRKASPDLLKRYLAGEGVGEGLDWDSSATLPRSCQNWKKVVL